VAAQSPRFDIGAGISVNSEEERYLRTLQSLGLVRAYPWTIRGFLPSEGQSLLPADSVEHPWEGAFDVARERRKGFRFGTVAPEVAVVFNSTYPYGSNDGAVWAGRGLTGVTRGGIYARWGPVHLRLAPEAFWAQNADFELVENGLEGAGAFLDPRYPYHIDLPQRFGGEHHSRLSLGSSELSVTLPGVTLGAGGSAKHWGPSESYPLLLGDEAGGFPHAFVRTTRPLNAFIGGLQAYVMVGYLGQSTWSTATGEPGRFTSGSAVVLTPAVFPGLEIGVERFVSGPWSGTANAMSKVLKPFGTGVSTGTADGNPGDENQLAGAFIRWVLPNAGLEVYAEAVREDFGRDMRHLLVEPDDLMARVLGLRRTWSMGPDKIRVLRGEVVSAEVHHSERGDRVLVYGAQPYPRYLHGVVSQGHTVGGQLLSSTAAFSGSGWTVAVDSYGPTGRTTLEVTREKRLDWLPAGRMEAGLASVRYGLSLQSLRAWRGSELLFAINPSVELNRNLVRGNTAWNLNIVLGMRGLGL